MKIIARMMTLLIVPMGLFIGSIVFLLNLDTMPPAMLIVTKYASYVLFAAAALISWWFNRSRVFFCILVLTFSQLAVTIQLPEGMDTAFYMKEVYAFIAVFIPLNMIVISFFKERGILTLWGILRMGILFLQAFFFVWWIGAEKKGVSNLLAVNFVFGDWHVFTTLSQTAWILFLFAAATLLLRYALYELYIDISFASILPFLITAFYMKDQKMAVPVFFAASGLVLIIAIIRDSYFMAFMDELTGLPSRRALKHELMKLSGRYTIAMLDVDFFKKFNDKYGHDVGDQVLKLVAAVMREVSGGGKPFRYGGEEFTILFPGKNLSDAVPHLDELREKISKRGFTQRSKGRPKKKPKSGGTKSGNGKQLFVTMSIGVAEKNEKYKDPDAVIKAADTALYRAKKKGRNCVSK